MNFKNVNIGHLIRQRVMECGIGKEEIINFFGFSEKELEEIYGSENLDTEFLFQWSKLFEYDFFRLYTQHLILHAPQRSVHYKRISKGNLSVGFRERKNIYTKEIIDFIIELIEMEIKTEKQVIEDYGIPKSTLSKWLIKYKNLE